MSEFVERLEKKLAEINCKRSFFVNAVGIKNQSITDWSKRGTIPAADICLRMADFLGVSVRWLLTGEEEKIPRDVLCMAYEIASLPPPLRSIVLATLESCKAQCAKQEEGRASDAG